MDVTTTYVVKYNGFLTLLFECRTGGHYLQSVHAGNGQPVRLIEIGYSLAMELIRDTKNKTKA